MLHLWFQIYSLIVAILVEIDFKYSYNTISWIFCLRVNQVQISLMRVRGWVWYVYHHILCIDKTCHTAADHEDANLYADKGVIVKLYCFERWLEVLFFVLCTLSWTLIVIWDILSFVTSHESKMSMILDLLEICIESCQIFISVTSSIWWWCESVSYLCIWSWIGRNP
jgi:hypothetical protein